MPFDRLPGRINSVPQLVHFYVPPPRPVIPYGEWITNAVDKIAQAADPIERAKRKYALQELSLAPQKLSLERAKLNYEQNLFGKMQSGQAGHVKFLGNGQIVPLSPLEEATLSTKQTNLKKAKADMSPDPSYYDSIYGSGHAAATQLPTNPDMPPPETSLYNNPDDNNQ